jgi:hypothetical protein
MDEKFLRLLIDIKSQFQKQGEHQQDLQKKAMLRQFC